MEGRGGFWYDGSITWKERRMTREGIPFSKLNGSGNDFLLIDNRGGAMEGIDRPAFAAKVCDRSRSVGADGVIIVEPSRKADFRWDFYNADGSRAEMCGNGGRCAARFASAWPSSRSRSRKSFPSLASLPSSLAPFPLARA